MIRSRPLRFLAVLLGGWAAVRGAMLAPPWWSGPAEATAAAGPPNRVLAGPPPRHEGEAVRGRTATAAARPGKPATFVLPGPVRAAPRAAVMTLEAPGRLPPLPIAELPAPPPSPPSGEIIRRASRAGRASLYGWTFLRPGGGPGLAPGGTLGGSQAGLRASYRINRDSERPLALAVRLASPLADRTAAEAALGIEWRPSRRLPVRLLAERRQRLGREGRSAFAVMVHGGIDEAPLGPVRIDAYGQAGIVGARARDPFADGALRVSMPLSGRARLGAGAWAAAQPGATRLDIGPQASLRLRLGGGSVTVAADWRLRVAGKARPGSGPALTLATDF